MDCGATERALRWRTKRMAAAARVAARLSPTDPGAHVSLGDALYASRFYHPLLVAIKDEVPVQNIDISSPQNALLERCRLQ